MPGAIAGDAPQWAHDRATKMVPGNESAYGSEPATCVSKP